MTTRAAATAPPHCNPVNTSAHTHAARRSRFAQSTPPHAHATHLQSQRNALSRCSLRCAKQPGRPGPRWRALRAARRCCCCCANHHQLQHHAQVHHRACSRPPAGADGRLQQPESCPSRPELGSSSCCVAAAGAGACCCCAGPHRRPHPWCVCACSSHAAAAHASTHPNATAAGWRRPDVSAGR